eukprot:4800171-Alexandrium_andersonii.AAC.1
MSQRCQQEGCAKLTATGQSQAKAVLTARVLSARSAGHARGRSAARPAPCCGGQPRLPQPQRGQRRGPPSCQRCGRNMRMLC